MSRDQRASGPIIGRPTKMVGSLIGFGSEAWAHRKEKKARETEEQEKSQQGPSTHASGAMGHESMDDDDDDEQLDEEDWALDDASTELSADAPARAHASLLESLLPPMPFSGVRPLQYPVVLPQRRPQTKSRGFVRAYAPLLGQCKGIDETTFLTFLDELYQNTQASSALQAVNVGSQFVGMVPGVITMSIAMAMSMGARAGIEAQGRYKTNAYLNQINEKLFNPRGIHCVVMTFKPGSSQKVVEVDFNTTNDALMKNMSNPNDRTMSKFKKASSGTARSEFAIPEAAPLIYSTIDQAAFAVSESGEPLPEKKQNAMKRTTAFAQDYLDRRAHAEYTGVQGDYSKLSVPGASDQQKFASRYSDPNHPANSGSILALLTGGAFDPRAKARTQRAEVKNKVTGGHALSEQERHNVAMGRGAPGGLRHGPIRALRKKMHEDVLYLLIAEIPTRQEMMELENMQLEQ